jgi:hypothetical protein
LRRAQASHGLEILEWGSGRSTLYYSGLLANTGVSFRWLSLEYDRDFFQKEVEPQLDRLTNPYVLYLEDSEAKEVRLEPDPTKERMVELVVFDKGRLQPMLRAFSKDRYMDMDAYVAFPAGQGRRYDVILVDGRKRRRCLIEAAKLLKDDGIVLLHDAWRPYYHCAFDHFQGGRRIGDILWIGSQNSQDVLAGLLEGLCRL